MTKDEIQAYGDEVIRVDGARGVHLGGVPFRTLRAPRHLVNCAVEVRLRAPTGSLTDVPPAVVEPLVNAGYERVA